MKTLTELNGSVVRAAAAAIAEARRALPKDGKPTDTGAAEAAPETAVSEAAVPTAVIAPAEGAVADAAGETVAEAGAAVPSGAAPKEPERGAESEAVKAALDEAVAKATGFSGDRLAMLRAAAEIAGRRAEDVRLVRVFGLDEQLSGARVLGAYQYVLDFFPREMRQVAGAPKDERGRGGGRRGGGRGGGGGGGARGANASATGGFSMDSLRDDRKSERGGRGRPGGGRRPGDGGGRPSRPPGGEPKK